MTFCWAISTFWGQSRSARLMVSFLMHVTKPSNSEGPCSCETIGRGFSSRRKSPRVLSVSPDGDIGGSDVLSSCLWQRKRSGLTGFFRTHARKDGLMLKSTVVNTERGRVIIMDSITKVTPDDAGANVVSASHGGVSSGEFALAVPLSSVFFNDAGV